MNVSFFTYHLSMTLTTVRQEIMSFLHICLLVRTGIVIVSGIGKKNNEDICNVIKCQLFICVFQYSAEHNEITCSTFFISQVMLYCLNSCNAVSYTHLDVYKRQEL